MNRYSSGLVLMAPVSNNLELELVPASTGIIHLLLDYQHQASDCRNAQIIWREPHQRLDIFDDTISLSDAHISLLAVDPLLHLVQHLFYPAIVWSAIPFWTNRLLLFWWRCHPGGLPFLGAGGGAVPAGSGCCHFRYGSTP